MKTSPWLAYWRGSPTCRDAELICQPDRAQTAESLSASIVLPTAKDAEDQLTGYRRSEIHGVIGVTKPKPCHGKLNFMRPSEALILHRARIREIVLAHRVSGVRVFGSALRGDDVAGSDLDLLVEPTAQTTLMDIGSIRYELKKLLNLEVDALTPNSLPASFREQILCEARPL